MSAIYKEDNLDTATRRVVSEETFRRLVDSVKDYAIYMIDPAGYVISWNAGAERLKGYGASEIVGAHFSSFYAPEDLREGKPQKALQTALAQGRSEDEGWRVRKDGSRFWASALMTAVYDERGQLRGFAKVTRDLTERRRSEEDRMRLVHAQEAVRLREEFLSIASHELRTPLNALKLYLQATQLSIGAEGKHEAGEKLEKSLRQVVRLEQLIGRLLDASRVAAGRLKLTVESVELCEVIRSAVESLQIESERTGSEIILDLPEAVHGAFDKMRIEQVVMNILHNAIKYGGGRPITIKLANHGASANITISDQGKGIAQEEIDGIFERFVSGASAGRYDGLGLGLYIAQHIVESHDGSIGVESSPGAGAKFHIQLPLQRGKT